MLGLGVFAVTITLFYLSIASPPVQLIWWWDIPMHFLGGAWAGLIAAWFILIACKEPTVLECIGFALFCGVAVEILEFLTGFQASPFMHPALDTAKDFILDAFGGYAAYSSVRVFKAI